MFPVFEACLTLAQNPNEAQLLAESLEALARALREWPLEAWHKVGLSPTGKGLFERLVARTQAAALDSRQRVIALESAEAVADVLRVLWPETRPRVEAAPDLLLTTS
jgi:hypothetical protein